MRVRRATEGDRLALFKLCADMHAETDFRHYTLAPAKVIDGLGYWIHAPEALMLVAESDDDGVIGFFAAKITRPWFSDDLCAVEDCFYVAAEHRGSRAAFKLAREFKTWAADRGALHMRAGVSSGAGPAGERLYQHLGMDNMGGNFVAHLKEQTHVLQ